MALERSLLKEKQEQLPEVIAVVLTSSQFNRNDYVTEVAPERNLRSYLYTDIPPHISIFPGKAGVIDDNALPDLVNHINHQFSDLEPLEFSITGAGSTGGGYYGFKIDSLGADWLHYEIMRLLSHYRNPEHMPSSLNSHASSYNQLLQARFGHDRLLHNFINHKHMTFLYDPSQDQELAEKYMQSLQIPSNKFYFNQLTFLRAAPLSWEVREIYTQINMER